ncbi:uncharacterized protein [Ptychodera flava]|uniref:uncharacterized protein isoform X1 n=1 Tax=Ptychodera flava TaxID=63121 RepID=UPI003969BCB0
MKCTIDSQLRRWQALALAMLAVGAFYMLFATRWRKDWIETSIAKSDMAPPFGGKRTKQMTALFEGDSQRVNVTSQDDICKSALKTYYDGLAVNGSSKSWWFCPKLHDILWNCLKPHRKGAEPLPNFYKYSKGIESHYKYKNASVAFLHLPKCGGTSVNNLVFKMAGGVRNTHDIRHCLNFFKLAYSLSAKMTSQIFMISKRVYGLHYFAPSNRPFLYFAWFRDPVDRFLSQFHFLRNFRNKNADVRGSKNLTDFLKKTEDKQEHFFDNFFVRLLQFGDHRQIDDDFEPRDGACESYAKGAPVVTEEHFLTAKRNLEDHIAYVGVLEDFKTSQDMLCYMMGIQCPEQEIHKNLNPKRPKDDISAFELREIQRRNIWDIKLYETAMYIYSKQREKYMAIVKE